MSPWFEIHHLNKTFTVDRGPFQKPFEFKALKAVNLTIEKGECWGLIGESGSGKTTLGRIAARLMTADEGLLNFDGQAYDLSRLSNSPTFRKSLQIVFQMASNPLDPLRTVQQLLKDPLALNFTMSPEEQDKKIAALLTQVGLSEDYLYRYPLQLSGGERQRLCITRALATEPQFLILDEPASALDVSVQGQIMSLLSDLKAELNLTYLFITHDLRLARKFCSHIAVMKDGEIVESGPATLLFENPQHEYTRHLLRFL